MTNKTIVRWRLGGVFLALALLGLACSLPGWAPVAEPTPDDTAQQATQVALAVQATLQAQPTASSNEAAAPTPTPPAVAPPTPIPLPAATPTASLPDFETWMRSAQILVYEDMIAATDVKPYLADALDGLGVSYVYVGDALGRFKTQLVAGAPGGGSWDLIISAQEAHTAVSGEFYEYLDDALAAGSAVIIENWDIDAIWRGKIERIFSRCGVEFQEDWPQPSTNDQVLAPLNADHPIHHTPNEGIMLSNPTNYWGYEYGDLIRLRPGSEALLLWGTLPNTPDRNGLAAVCVDGRLILQTYCTHSYGYDRVVPMWENYIYNALRARYEYLLAHSEG